MPDRHVAPSQSDLYGGYSAFQKRVGNGVGDRDLDRYSTTFAKILLPKPVCILELGFGEGHFLEWARQVGYGVEGVEILPDLIAQAQSRGHFVHRGPLAGLSFKKDQFDLLAAFDVVEHLSLAEVVDLLERALYFLKPAGKILLQFPNAGSPFSALYQHGDLTHKQAVSWQSLEQLATTQGWMVEQFFNARVTSLSAVKKFKWWLAHRMRDAIEVILGVAYYGRRVPLDPNIVVVLTQTAGRAGV